MSKVSSKDNGNSRILSAQNAYVSQASSKGVGNIFIRQHDKIPTIIILPGVDNDFAENITQVIEQFPTKWLKKFREEGYEIILSKTINGGYKHKNLFDPDVIRSESQNHEGLLGMTYSEGKDGTNFFIFADKPPCSDKFMKGIVNHEFSHGIVNVSDLEKNPAVISAIKKDFNDLVMGNKLEQLSQNEQNLLRYYFFNPDAVFPRDEILAETLAWQQEGGGVHGSGLIFSVYNPNLIPSVFPNISKLVKDL